jgi:hypothetical protein
MIDITHNGTYVATDYNRVYITDLFTALGLDPAYYDINVKIESKIKRPSFNPGDVYNFQYGKYTTGYLIVRKGDGTWTGEIKVGTRKRAIMDDDVRKAIVDGRAKKGKVVFV